MIGLPNTTKQTAFTLIEVIMVVAIIAILAALALPSQMGQITQKRIIETFDLVQPHRQTVSDFYRNKGQLPKDNKAAGMPEPNKILGNYLEGVEVVDGAMHLTLGQKLPKNLHGKIITYQPVYVPDSPNSEIDWICGYDEVPQGMEAAGNNLTNIEKLFLPGRCR